MKKRCFNEKHIQNTNVPIILVKCVVVVKKMIAISYKPFFSLNKEENGSLDMKL